MSQQSILDKSIIIRNESQEYANTRGRIANVIDDINETKANREEVTEEIGEAIDFINISSKIDKPVWSGAVQFYFVKSDSGNANLQPLTLEALRAPYWTGSNFTNSPIYVSPDGLRIGIGASSVSEALEVSGRVKASSFIIPANVSSPVANRLRSDGGVLWYANASSVEKRIAFDETGVNVPTIYLTATSINISTTVDANGYKMYGKSIIHDAPTTITITVSASAGIYFICEGVKANTGNISFVAAAGITLILEDFTSVVSGLKASSYRLRQLSATEFALSIKNLE